MRIVATDAELVELAETMASPGFARIQDRIRKYRETCVTQLIHASTWEEAKALQGQIEGASCALSIPEILRKERLKT